MYTILLFPSRTKTNHHLAVVYINMPFNAIPIISHLFHYSNFSLLCFVHSVTHKII